MSGILMAFFIEGSGPTGSVVTVSPVLGALSSAPSGDFSIGG